MSHLACPDLRGIEEDRDECRARGDHLSREGNLEHRGPRPALAVAALNPHAGENGEFDGIVKMYHDHDQIAMKFVGFDQGVTVQGDSPSRSRRRRTAPHTASSGRTRP